MICWHKWGKWLDGNQEILHVTTNTKYTITVQVRHCRKCGKKEIKCTQ